MWEAEWGGKVFFSHGSTHSKGVMILVNPKVELKIEKVISDNNGRYIIIDAMVDDSQVILVNIYAPKTSTNSWPSLMTSNILFRNSLRNTL